MKNRMDYKIAHLHFDAMPGVEPFTGWRLGSLAECLSLHCSKISTLMVQEMTPSAGTVFWDSQYIF